MSKEPEEKQHIVPYRTYILVLLALVTFTLTSVGITSIRLGPFTVLGALLLSMAKTSLVLAIFMHLKFDQRIFRILVMAVFLLIGVVISITFLDYLFR